MKHTCLLQKRIFRAIWEQISSSSVPREWLLITRLHWGPTSWKPGYSLNLLGSSLDISVNQRMLRLSSPRTSQMGLYLRRRLSMKCPLVPFSLTIFPTRDTKAQIISLSFGALLRSQGLFQNLKPVHRRYWVLRVPCLLDLFPVS